VPELIAFNRPARYIGQMLSLAAVYFVVAKLSLLLAIPPGYASPVWPSSGIALAASSSSAIAAGRRVAGRALVNLTVETSIGAALMIGTGNTLEAVVGGRAHRRFCGGLRCFERGEEVLGFVAAPGLSGTIAATVAMARSRRATSSPPRSCCRTGGPGGRATSRE
jgi:integral membrane sensor domain MASE1